MNLLLIEDDKDLVDLLLQEFATIRPKITVNVARSRDSALALLASSVFDFIICDLNIPTEDGALDHHVDHGNALQVYIVNDVSGTPVLILSGFAELEMMEDLIKLAKQADLFGDGGNVPMLQYLPKDKLHECIDYVAEYSSRIQELDDIAMSGTDIDSLIPQDARIMRVFARRLSGAKLDVHNMPGGLSGSRTYLLDVFDRHHRQRGYAVAKIDYITEVVQERERARRLIAPMLKSGCFAQDIGIVEAGAGQMGGLFYRRDQDFSKTLFELIAENPDNAVSVVGAIRKIQEPWISHSDYDTFTIRHVRKWFESDEKHFEKLPSSIDWEAFEAREIQCHVGIQHGDLHPGNVLVDSSNEPLLIDFARSSDNLSLVVDPLSMEFSLLFHPVAKNIRGDWPSLEAVGYWPDIEAFIDGCPVPEFVLMCRKWAEGVYTSQRELLTVAYGYAVRQLRYDDVDSNVASAIIATSIDRFNHW